jgi:hypothetical protein
MGPFGQIQRRRGGVAQVSDDLWVVLSVNFVSPHKNPVSSGNSAMIFVYQA